MPSIEELKRIFMVAPATAPLWHVPAYSSSALSSVPEASDIHRVPESPLGPCAIAIGAFDGMHIGHQSLLAATVSSAHRAGLAAYALTFDPDPDEVVAPHPAKRLLLRKQRFHLLCSSGVDGVLVVPFTHELAALDHIAFFEQVVFPYANVQEIHVGSDFKLGYKGASTVDIMRPWLEKHGIALIAHHLVSQDGSAISATRIRHTLAATHVEDAARELGRAYMVEGPVRSGRGKGTGMGFPTANIVVDPAVQMPGDGVYAGLARVNRIVYPAAINVGIPPMFKNQAHVCPLEVNLIGYSGNLYQSRVAVAFTSFLRPSVVFPSNQALIDAVLDNIATIKSMYGSEGQAIAPTSSSSIDFLDEVTR